MKHLFSLASLLSLPNLALAQQPDSVVQLPPVVVTADRHPVERATVPATVTVLDGAALRERGLVSVADALAEVPGVALATTGSFGSPTSLFMRGGESNYVKVLVDGVPLNDAGGAVDLAHLTLDNVERIEVLRGPASVVYGSDAVAGVVQIFTRRGRGPMQSTVRFGGGTYGALDMESGIAGGTERLGMSATVARHSTDGLYEFNSGYRNLVTGAALDARPDAATRAQLAVRYWDADVHYPTDGNGAVVDRNALRTEQRIMGVLGVSRAVWSGWALEGQLTLDRADGGLDDSVDGPSDTLGVYASSEQSLTTRAAADVRVVGQVGRGVLLTAGATLEHEADRRSSVSESSFGPFSGASDTTRLNRGYYVQAHVTHWGPLSVSAGARLDDNEMFGTFVTGRGGAALELASGTRVRGSVGTAFKEPTFSESFSNASYAKGNPALEPERTTTWEMGVEQSLVAQRVWLSAAYFQQRFRDLIQYTFAPPSPTDPNYFNVAAADASGVELEARAVPVGGLAVTGNATFLHTEVVDAGLDTDGLQFVTGQRLLRRPALTWMVGVEYRRPGTGSASLTFRRVGDRIDRDFSTFPATAVTLPAYQTVDVAGTLAVLRWGDGASRVSLDARVANLLDAQYASVYGFPAPGRRVLLGMTAAF